MKLNRKEFLDIFSSIDFNQIRDHPNILIAARFWNEERYIAACTCYKYMRSLDDLIDEHKAKNKLISPEERTRFKEEVRQWLMMIPGSFPDHELSKTMTRFLIPLWPFETFARSMTYDIDHNGFPTLQSFLEYSQGAAVAPASIFVHLNGLIEKDGRLQAPPFDVREAATPCAVFSYLVHIIRDFQKDQHNNLTYFADDLIGKYHLTRNDLRNFANSHPINDQFRGLIGEYYRLADDYRLKTLAVMEKINPLLEPRYQLSLRIIFDLYLMVFERIHVSTGNFTTGELNPAPDETAQRVYDTIIRFTDES